MMRRRLVSKRLLGLGALGLLAYLVFLIALFPASQAWRLAAPQLTEPLPGLQLAGLDGTLWQGRAGQLAWQGHTLGQLEWRLSALSLLRLHGITRVSMQDAHGHLQGRVATPLRGGPLTLNHLEGRFPIQQLSRFAAFIPVVIDGQLSLNLPRLELDANGLPQRAEGQVVWHQAVISLTEPMPLGDLRAVLHTDEEGLIHGEISDVGGPLRINARLRLQPDGQYRLNGHLAPGEGASAALQQALGWLGRPDSQGQYPLNFTGKLR